MAAEGEDTTNTTESDLVVGDDEGGTGGGDLREPGIGLQAGFERRRFGDLSPGVPEVLGVVEIQADYSSAVEAVESSWAWLLGLLLLIATALVSGLDRRRLAGDREPIRG